ncbi:ubiquinol-cytochrome c reductase iron-sulfur subunit [Brevibacterium sp. HMSC07C04]|uniref:QcrA and Rieske domain-containing protein n=1 Tax=Brevibacterium sp. HMSC07C04 TaxID=1581130 RepID=UPI0008A59A56|nr:Rieske (2Fe-2S) protein [Brevibacterium sp. HMSC07C04]OFS27623.1 hypothetical protein HMPREF3162_01515 [Brevibacterium sp. HMSC07C04]
MSTMSRRDVFKGAGVIGTVAATGAGLAACSSQDLGEIELNAADVPEGSGVIKDNFVVVQPEKGQFKAFSAVCPHQGCLVNQVDEEKIVCPCHTSHFSSKDGSFISGAAQQGLEEAQLTQDGDKLHVSAK